MNTQTAHREFFANMGEAVAKRTILRRVPDTTKPDELLTVTFEYPILCNRIDITLMKWLADNDKAVFDRSNYAILANDQKRLTVQFTAWPARDETWGEVAARVALGNTGLICNLNGFETEELRQAHVYSERSLMEKHLRSGGLLMSGRHLQHGDHEQSQRRLELFSNCSTAALSAFEFFLLLSGCFRAGTPVLMADGTYKPIETVQPGDRVTSYDESLKKFVDQTVLRLNVNPPKPMVRVTFANGDSTVCTADHKFLTDDGTWVEAVDLKGKITVQSL